MPSRCEPAVWPTTLIAKLPSNSDPCTDKWAQLLSAMCGEKQLKDCRNTDFKKQIFPFGVLLYGTYPFPNQG